MSASLALRYAQKLGALDDIHCRGCGQDGTLVLTKSNQPYVTSPDDFKLFNKEVPKVLNEYAEKGYKIVVFRCDIFL